MIKERRRQISTIHDPNVDIYFTQNKNNIERHLAHTIIAEK